MSQKFFIKSALAAMLSALAGATFAGGSYTGTFRPYFFSDNLYIEETSVQSANVAACVGTRKLLKLASDPNSAAFRQEYATLLAAWFAGRPLYILGNGTCTSETDEIILQIQPN